jgi:uncharacterized protein (DUF1778 family)
LPHLVASPCQVRRRGSLLAQAPLHPAKMAPSLLVPVRVPVWILALQSLWKKAQTVAASPCSMRNACSGMANPAPQLRQTRNPPRALAGSDIMRYPEEMSDRTALILSCTREQAATIHQRAAVERRTVSAYVLRILMRRLDLEERIVARQEGSGRSLMPYQPVRTPGKRTTMLIRCSKEEAQRIRAGAKRRCTTISWFVLHTLTLAWNAGDEVLMQFRQ